MICTEVDGMRRLIFKVFLPVIFIAVWLNISYYPCLGENGQLDTFKFLLIAGLPFGIKAMGGIFYPVGFDLQGGIVVLALNLILGGIIGVFALAFTILGIIKELIEFVIFDVLLRNAEVIDLDMID